MTADYCDLTEAYNKIVTECYPAQEAEIKIRCSKYFSEYCKKKKSTMQDYKSMPLRESFQKGLRLIKSIRHWL